jgi:NitT/TauT family transport system ATP-binding protein
VSILQNNLTLLVSRDEPEASASSMPTLITLDHLGITYTTSVGPVEAIQDVSLSVREGEFVAIVGPSGCGKSTLLRTIAGLLPTSSGRVLFKDRPVDGPLRSVGMVFQTPVLLPWRNILDNVLLGAELAGKRRAEYRERALSLLALTGLHDFAQRMPRELSGGMQQRASLCRALLLDPPLLLMDEPFGALDAMTRDDMNLELLRIWSQQDGARKTIFFVTHSIPEAVFLADRVVAMSPRPGRIARIFDVPLERPRRVAQRASAEFGSLNLEIHETLKVTTPGSATFL